MKHIKNIITLFILCMIELHIQGIQSSFVVQPQTAKTMISNMEQSLQHADKSAFAQQLHEYINLFGQTYEKQSGLLGAYQNVVYIASQHNESQALTPAEHQDLMKVLDQAARQNDWATTLTLQLSVADPQTLLPRTKTLNLYEIIHAINYIPLSNRYWQTAMITGATLGTLALGASFYHYMQQHPNLLQQGVDTMHYGWEDLQDSMHQFSKYFTEPQNYEAFEKKHDLLSEDMSKAERIQRFTEWQAGEQIQQSIDNKMKAVKRFEKKLNLPTDNMNEEDRLEIFKDWQRQERDAQRLNQKMQPVEQFEKKHKLLSDNMTDKERQKRFKDWQTGDKQQKMMHEKMKDVKSFEKKHAKLSSEGMTEDARLQRFKDWQKGDLRQKDIDKQMKEVEKFEKEMNLSTENMHYEDRIKIFEEWKAINQHEKMMHGLEQWEARWEMNADYDNGYFDRSKNQWIYPSITLTEEERIERYMRKVDPILRYLLENDLVKY